MILESFDCGCDGMYSLGVKPEQTWCVKHD